MEEDFVYIVFRTYFGINSIVIVLPNEEMAKDYIKTIDVYGSGDWRFEKHEIKHEF